MIDSPKIKSHGRYVELRATTSAPFKNMRVIGTLPGSDIKNVNTHIRHESPYSKLYTPIQLSQLKAICQDKFYVVQPTHGNYYKTVSSWDLKPDYHFVGDPGFAFGLVFFETFYRTLFSDCVAESEEICGLIDWTKSPGWPHTFYGFRSKAELVQVMSKTTFYNRTGYIPIWNVSGKLEFKAMADIEAGKIRLFQVPCYELLYSQLKFGKRISLGLMNFRWSAYGFNPYSGGFNTLAEKLLRHPWRGCYDVSGWDKFLPLLPYIYNILQKFIPPEHLEEFMWMAVNTAMCALKTTDGLVFLKDYGNPSGSGNTTRDNIFGHIIIFSAGLYRAYTQHVGCPPSYELVESQMVYLYGDDNVYSLDDEFQLMCDQKFLSEHLQMFGLKLKFFYGGLDCDLHTLSFLGATFKNLDGIWYPQYDIERIATTMVYEQARLSLSQHVGKAFTLMVMSYPSAAFEIFRNAYKNLLESKEIKNHLDDSAIKSYHLVGVPDNKSIQNFYTGSESEQIGSVFVFSHLPVNSLDMLGGLQN